MHTLIQFSSVTQLCLTLFDRINCFPVYHQLPELVQTHVHQVGNAIQPSHPLSSPSPAFNLSQQQGLFIALGGQSIGSSASVLQMVWGGRREEGSGWGTHVYLWQIHFDIWQNQYNIVKWLPSH